MPCSDLLVDSDWFKVDVADYLRRFYVGQQVVIALVRGGDTKTPERVRQLLGHYDPQRAAAGTIRGDLGNRQPGKVPVREPADREPRAFLRRCRDRLPGFRYLVRGQPL